MKSLLFSLSFLFISGVISAQKDPYVYTISKDGKKNHKECLAITVRADQVTFVVTGTTYQIFYKVGSDSGGSDLWADGANNKIVTRQVEKDGTVVFWKSEKKAFYYKP